MVIATFTITPDRKNTWNFSTPYYTDAVSLLVKKNSGIKTYSDLTDKLIGVAEGATSKDALKASAAANGVTLDDNANFRTFPDYPSIKAALGCRADQRLLRGRFHPHRLPRRSDGNSLHHPFFSLRTTVLPQSFPTRALPPLLKV